MGDLNDSWINVETYYFLSQKRSYVSKNFLKYFKVTTKKNLNAFIATLIIGIAEKFHFQNSFLVYLRVRIASQTALVVKNIGDIRDAGSTSGLGRSPGRGYGNPLQYTCLENPMDQGAWWASVHRVLLCSWPESSVHRLQRVEQDYSDLACLHWVISSGHRGRCWCWLPGLWIWIDVDVLLWFKLNQWGNKYKAK